MNNNNKQRQRLRGATCFSPYHSPSCMTVHQTGSNTDGNINTRRNTRSLAAIANPMGITIIDINKPQRSYLTLNYSTSTISTSTTSYTDKSIGTGGITTMAFQPCFTSQLNDSTTNGTSSYIQSTYTTQQHPILLATARGNGILIWDCSGNSLSPLLGRLNACDSWSSKKRRKNVAGAMDDTTNKEVRNKEGKDIIVDESGHQPSSSLDSSTATTQEKSSILSPISIERQPSVLSVSSNANNNNNLLNTSSNSGGGTTINQSGLNKSSAAATTSSVLMNNNNVVTSLDWKKTTSAPILLATCGASCCIWDLRTSLFSGLTSSGGISSSGGGGCRPNLRFTITPQSDQYYNPSTTLIHCSYSISNEYTFATLDNLGVVRVWDERKPGEFPIQSFVGCSGGGVGIASISPCQKNEVYYSRWVTWGMDDNDMNEDEQHNNRSDDLIVKVWTESSSSSSSLKKVHKRTLSTSTNADVSNRSEDTRISGTNTDDVYDCTSRISMQGGVAARVHPSFPNGILLFRDAAPSSSQRQGEGALPSPNTAGAATPEMVSAQTPPSPPPLMLDEAVQGKKTTERLESSRDHQGWEAELWCIDEDTPVVTDTDTSEEAANDTTTAHGAKKIASFRGGGAEDDALNFAPRRGVSNESSDVIAVDLALGVSPKKEEELSVCVLTKAGRLTVYGVPEASELVKDEEIDTSPNKRERSDSKSNPMARSLSPAVYRQGALDHHASQWWNKNEEEDLFGEASSRDSPKKSSMESLSSAALDKKSTNDNVAEKAITVGQSISSDVSASMEEVVVSQDAETSTNNIPIDPARAARVPCPPLCGVAFSGTGELIMFNNGPVKQMWSYYQANDALSPNGPKSLSSTISFEPNNTKNSSDTNTANEDEEKESDQDQVTDKKTLPRTLADLVDMNLRSQTLQWGEGNDDQPDNDDEEDEEEDDGSSSDNSSEVALDDDSDDDSDDDDDLEGSYHMVSNDPQHKREDSSDMFDEYFGSSRKPLLGEENKGANEVFAGLPSLSPSVLITRKYDDILLNGQTPQLANMLKLGDEWWLSQDFSVPDIGRCQIIKKNTTDSKDTKQEPSSGDNSRECSSMMGSLKKMFANQLPSTIAAAHSNNNKQTTEVGAHLDRSGHALTNFDGSYNVDQPGVYMLDNPQTPEAASQRLLITQELCLYNAKVCLDCGQKSKTDTWTLLAQTVENILTFEADETDGWAGDEDVLTTGIVEQILRWYEVQGDYQMLATIVCVLTFGRDRRDMTASVSGGRYQLLPKFDDRRYDNYIHRYGTLLYAWGLLTVRSEISKRLAYGVSNDTAEGGDDDQMSGSFISMVCTRCVEPVSDVNGICSKCKEYAFQCSVCCSAVRGAYTWCLLCNHGGHVQCHQAWFEQQKMCPSGCGCDCKMISGSTTS